MATEIGGTKIVFGDRRQPKALSLSHPKARYGGFKPGTTLLPKGHVQRRGCKPLPCAIRFERDQAIKLRDGVTIYADIYRPVASAEENTCPAIVAWSPYGKTPGGGNQILDDFPFRMGVPLRDLSELQKWEGPDPGYWVQRGYAIVNPDPRGVGKSEGNIYTLGNQEARDGADVIDWIGEQSWCNGKVGMSGNSWLAVAQWSIAAQRPKHLAAIAPWEGLSDVIGEAAYLGGVESRTALDFITKVLSMNAGENSWENLPAMVIGQKAHGEYHRDKQVAIEDIEVPAYVVCSWTHAVHPFGTFRSFCRLQSPKWLRVHDSVEWPDYYDPTSTIDLHRFFDRYLKNIDNNWESTPRFRAMVLDTANPLPKTGSPISASEFPPQNTPLLLFLDSTQNTFSPTYPQQSQISLTMSSNSSASEIIFEHTFATTTVLCGTLEIQLAVSLRQASDADLFLYIDKLSTTRQRCEQLTIPFASGTQTSFFRFMHWTGLFPATKMAMYAGPRGAQRLSRREEDPSQPRVPGLPIARMDVAPEVPVRQGEVLVVRPAMFPIGMVFRKEETLRLRIGGRDELVFPPMDRSVLTAEGIEDVNVAGGVVTVHCGLSDPGRASYITLPVVEGGLVCP